MTLPFFTGLRRKERGEGKVFLAFWNRLCYNTSNQERTLENQCRGSGVFTTKRLVATNHKAKQDKEMTYECCNFRRERMYGAPL